MNKIKRGVSLLLCSLLFGSAVTLGNVADVQAGKQIKTETKQTINNTKTKKKVSDDQTSGKTGRNEENKAGEGAQTDIAESKVTFFVLPVYTQGTTAISIDRDIGIGQIMDVGFTDRNFAVAVYDSLFEAGWMGTPGQSVKEVLGSFTGMIKADGYARKGVMGYIEIPAIDVMLPIYHGVSERVLRRGVGHMETTALPIGGKGTHSVLASHRGLSTAKLFTDLDRMKEGDLFYIHVLDHLLTYEVDQISVIEPEDTDALRPIADKEYITLLTCTPYGVNSHRLLVRGEKICDEIVKESEEKESDTAKKERDITEMIAYGAAVFALVSLFVAAVAVCVRKMKKKRRTRGRKKKAGKRSLKRRKR